MLRSLAALLKPAATALGSVVLTLLGLIVGVVAAFWQHGIFWGLIAFTVACFLLELRLDFEKRDRAAAEDTGGGRG